MKTLSIDTHPHDSAVDEELYELLKEGEDATSTGDDEDESTIGVTPDEYPDPEDRPTGGTDAPWGEDPGTPLIQSKTVLDYVQQSREGMLGDLLDSKAPSDAAEQATMGQHLQHAASGQFETSSPQLSGKAKQSSAPETLVEMTRRIAGRH